MFLFFCRRIAVLINKSLELRLMKYFYLNLLILLIICTLFSLQVSAQTDKTDKTDINKLRTQLNTYLSGHEGTFAVWFQHLDEPDLHFSIHADTVFHAASTMKTPVMIELFKRAEAGEFSMNDSIRIQNEFQSIVDGSPFSLDLDPESDDPFERKAGEKATIYNLTHAMITYSSNIATNLMIQLVGAEETTKSMKEMGAENIEVLRGVYDMKAFDRGLSNRTTARDLGIIFENIARHTTVSPEADQEMITILKDQFYKDVIPAKLPDEVITANKTGSISGVEHDSAIVYLPDGQSYVLIYLSKNLPDDEFGREIGANVSLMIHDWLLNN